MTCEHPRKWEMRQVSVDRYENVKFDDGTETISHSMDYTDVQQCLVDGWEPMNAQLSGYLFKRLKPCEECKKV